MDVCVVGSLMMDLVVYTDRRPNRGETIFGRDFKMTTGGKGFNQAVAAARAGASTSMIGRVGDDEFGQEFIRALRAEGVGASGLQIAPGAGTGVALPIVEADGSNSIIAVPRANHALTPADIAQVADQVTSARVVLMQLELPVDALVAATRMAHDAGCLVLLNVAPAVPVPDEMLAMTDMLIANEVEILAYGKAASPEECIANLQDTYPDLSVIVTQGELGAIARVGPAHLNCPAPAVEVVDSVGAGDAFCGYFAASLAQGVPIPSAISRAVHAASLSVTIAGSGLSTPRKEQTDLFMSSLAESAPPAIATD